MPAQGNAIYLKADACAKAIWIAPAQGICLHKAMPAQGSIYDFKVSRMPAQGSACIRHYGRQVVGDAFTRQCLHKAMLAQLHKQCYMNMCSKQCLRKAWIEEKRMPFLFSVLCCPQVVRRSSLFWFWPSFFSFSSIHPSYLMSNFLLKLVVY